MFLNDFTLYFLSVVSLTIYLKIPNEQQKKQITGLNQPENIYIWPNNRLKTRVKTELSVNLEFCLLQYPLMYVKKPLI